MTEEEWQHFVRLVEQARASIDDVASAVILGVPSRGSWWMDVETLRQAGERLSSACTAVQGKV